MSYNIAENTNITVYGIYGDKKYQDDVGDTGKRDDARYFLSVAATQQKVWFDWLNLSAEYTYTKNDSNIKQVVDDTEIDLFDYDRNTIFLSVSVNL